MKTKWNLKQQAEFAKDNVDSWPSWMKQTGLFAGSEPRGATKDVDTQNRTDSEPGSQENANSE